VCPIPDPAAPVELECLHDSGAVGADDVVAVVGKVDGSGNGDDAARALAASRIRRSLARRRSPGALSVAQVPVILSSGCAGIMSPALTVFFRRSAASAEPGRSREDAAGGLAVGTAISDPIGPRAIGRVAQVDAVAAATARALADAGDLDEVGAVLVKTPSLRPAHTRLLPGDLRTVSTAESMVYSIDATALGVGVALGEIDRASVTDEAVRRDWDLFSRVAIVSAGPEIDRAEVVVLGNAAHSTSDQRIGNALIRDPLDRDGVVEAISRASGGASGESAAHTVVQVFAKLILPVDDTVRGHPTSFFQEPSPAAVAKAVGAALVGSVIGRTDIYVSGGERGSHQGPPGAGPVAAIVRRDG
jgi:cyanuric acid amidohydrolase